MFTPCTNFLIFVLDSMTQGLLSCCNIKREWNTFYSLIYLSWGCILRILWFCNVSCLDDLLKWSWHFLPLIEMNYNCLQQWKQPQVSILAHWRFLVLLYFPQWAIFFWQQFELFLLSSWSMAIQSEICWDMNGALHPSYLLLNYF